MSNIKDLPIMTILFSDMFPTPKSVSGMEQYQIIRMKQLVSL